MPSYNRLASIELWHPNAAVLFAFDTRSVRLRPESDLIDIRPQLSRDIQQARGRIEGDPVEDGGRRKLFMRLRYDGFEIEPAYDLARGRVDLQHIRSLPLIGIKKTLHQL